MEQFTEPVKGSPMVKKRRQLTAVYKFRIALDVSKAIRWFSNALEI